MPPPFFCPHPSEILTSPKHLQANTKQPALHNNLKCTQRDQNVCSAAYKTTIKHFLFFIITSEVAQILHVCAWTLTLLVFPVEINMHIRPFLFAGKAPLSFKHSLSRLVSSVFFSLVVSPLFLTVLHPNPSHHSYEYFHISRGWLIESHC